MHWDEYYKYILYSTYSLVTVDVVPSIMVRLFKSNLEFIEGILPILFKRMKNDDAFWLVAEL